MQLLHSQHSCLSNPLHQDVVSHGREEGRELKIQN